MNEAFHSIKGRENLSFPFGDWRLIWTDIFSSTGIRLTSSNFVNWPEIPVNPGLITQFVSSSSSDNMLFGQLKVINRVYANVVIHK